MYYDLFKLHEFGLCTNVGFRCPFWVRCCAQLRLSHDSQESSFVGSRASFFGTLWRHEHAPCTCPFILLMFCLCVCWTPCLVLNPPFLNSKIPLLKTGLSSGFTRVYFYRTGVYCMDPCECKQYDPHGQACKRSTTRLLHCLRAWSKDQGHLGMT